MPLPPTQTDGMAVLGFVQTEAVLWHVHNRQEITRWTTKGNRHPKDIFVHRSPSQSKVAAQSSTGAGCDANDATLADSGVVFAYASGKCVNSFRISTGNIERALHGELSTSDGRSMAFRSLNQHFHGREVLSVVPLASEHGGSIWFATGSEDNTIKLVSFNKVDSSICSDYTHSELSHGGALKVEATLEGHPASVRALAMAASKQGRVLFSAGGKEAIYAWRLTEQVGCSTLPTRPGWFRHGKLCAHKAPERNVAAAKFDGSNCAQPADARNHFTRPPSR